MANITDINSVTLVGNITKDAELRTVGEGFSIVEMSVANNYPVKKGDKYESEASFFDLKMLGKRAAALHPHLKKGSKIAVSGKLRQERWEKDGQKKSRVIVLVDELEFVGGQKQQSGSGGDGQGGDGFPEDIPYSDDVPF